MLDFEKFIISLKITWIRRLIRDSDSPWAYLVNHQLNLSSKLFTYGPAWCEKPKTDNPFWKDVLNSWQYISQDCPIESGQDILHSPLWYNKKISQDPLFYPVWHQKGITFVIDLINANRTFHSMMELKELYNLPHVNVLEYYRIKLLTKAFLNKLKPDLNHYREMGPFLPAHLKIFFKSQKGATDIYKVMKKSSVQPKVKVKWCQEMNDEIENFVWRKIFRVCFRFSCDTSLT